MTDPPHAQLATKITSIPLVEKLLAEMTLAEKVGQMTQQALFVRETPDKVLDAIRQGKVGSFLNTKGLDHRNELQKVAVDESRLHIPIIFGRDVIHGFRTIFPIPLGQAASFDPALVERAAAVAAREAVEAGVDWTFAPMVDIARDARWGRVAEGGGEDAVLTAALGAAMVRGFQGSLSEPGGTRDPNRVAACAKHFAGYGASESGKDYNTTSIPEQLFRELYLPSFKACVDAGVLTLMSGFNDLNGIPASGNAFILRRILKGEWGFTGFVVSDWAALFEMLKHGYSEDEKAAGLAGAVAGIDMEMASTTFDHLPALIAEKKLMVTVLDEAVRRVLTVKHRLGLFERPYVEAPKTSVWVCDEHREVSRELARESIVLLKNDDAVLPFGKSVRKMAVVGPLADDALEQLGCWAFDGFKDKAVTVVQALRDRLGAAAITYEKGLPDCRSTDKTGFDAAVAAANQADVVVAVVGESANLSGEAKCRAFLDLPGAQFELLEKVAATGKPLVIVLTAGRPLVIGPLCALGKAVLNAWHLGTMAGPALVDILFGDVAPSGKLPISFPRTVGQIPVYYNHKNTGRPPGPVFRGVPAGTPLDPKEFSASYLDVEHTPELPFGFGLSYTTFAYDELSVSPAVGKLGQPVRVAFRVRNAGSVAGVETVQLYVRDLVGSITRPVRELKKFARVALAPGEARTLEFTLGAVDLAFPGPEMKTIVEPGKFEVFVGGDSRAELSAGFALS